MIEAHVRLELELDTVADAVDATWKRGAKILGFAIRADAQASLRDGRGSSTPGTPPRSHDGTLRRFLLYGFDQATRSVVVGPKVLKKMSRDAATALEEGGLSRDTQGRTQRIAARPFMRPALGRTIASKMAEAFADSLR